MKQTPFWGVLLATLALGYAGQALHASSASRSDMRPAAADQPNGLVNAGEPSQWAKFVVCGNTVAAENRTNVKNSGEQGVVMKTKSSHQQEAEAVLKALHAAINSHDVKSVVACFAQDVRSEQPRHPERSFIGRASVEKNWAANFAQLPDFHAEVIRVISDENVVWTEWRWSGTQANGHSVDLRGVTLFGVEEGLIQWARLYMDPVG
ncbi:nuclear transport factor 2 family protein [Deinococcus arboris]|nr:nuclear transport factor 2 family protein [Deinococcus arboris]